MAVYISDLFTSMSEKVEIEIQGVHYAEKPLQWILYAYDKENNEIVVCRNDVKKEKNVFSLSYYFDAVSLAIYRGAVKFRLALDGVDEAEEIKNLQISLREKTGNEMKNNNDAEDNYVISKTFNKILFIGNSLLLGMFGTYGMCATAPDKDYSYLVEKEIKKVYPDCKFYKHGGSEFEFLVNDEMYDQWFSSVRDIFEYDLDLIVLQLNDNINTPEKVAYFEKNVERFIKDIKKCSPNTEIIWVHGWFNQELTFEKIREVCIKFGIARVDISGIHTKETEAYSGQCAIQNDGTEMTVPDRWITHPGDAGMKQISEKILERIHL